VAVRRLTTLLGLSREEADVLADGARRRLGRRGYALRLAAFLVATAPLGRLLIPRAARLRAIRPFVHGLLPGPAENLLYAGVRPAASGGGDA
jgi:hypothetical protein